MSEEIRYRYNTLLEQNFFDGGEWWIEVTETTHWFPDHREEKEQKRIWSPVFGPWHQIRPRRASLMSLAIVCGSDYD